MNEKQATAYQLAQSKRSQYLTFTEIILFFMATSIIVLLFHEIKSK